MFEQNITQKSFWASKSDDVLDLLETIMKDFRKTRFGERIKYSENEISKRKKLPRTKIF